MKSEHVALTILYKWLRTGSLTHNDHMQFLRLTTETRSVCLPFSTSKQSSNSEFKKKKFSPLPSFPSLQQLWQIDYCHRNEHEHVWALCYISRILLIGFFIFLKVGEGCFLYFLYMRLTVNIRHSDQSELKTSFTNSHSKCPFRKDDVLGK